MLRRRGTEQAEKVAYTFLSDGETEAGHLSFGELERRARAIGAWLQTHGAQGERALLLFPSGLDYVAAFCGCFYAGAIAVPLALPQLSQSVQRLHAIADDAQPAFVLTTSHIAATVKPLVADAPQLSGLKWLAVDAAPAGLADEWREPNVSGDTLAFLQYTSGSTGTPKGVILAHDHLLHHSHQLSRIFEYNEQTSCVTWLPMYHNTGLIGVALQVLYGGFSLAFMSPVSFLERPARWLEAITRYKATVSAAPNFAYEMCIQAVAPEVRQRLDLSSWETAINGAEPIRTAALNRFVEVFAPCGFRREAFFPCYGLTEATLIVSGGPKLSNLYVQKVRTSALENHQVVEGLGEADEVKELVSSGEVLEDTEVVIVNPQRLTECAPNEVGEIWVKGRSVALGYWGRADETKNTFQGFLASTGEGPFLRTGDLGYLQGRQLFITGRLKDLIIIRGRNHYPQDIEQTVAACHAVLRPGFGAAFSIDAEGEERLVVVQEIKDSDGARNGEAIEAIRQAVARAHGIQVYVVALIGENTIPKTPSGKIQRHACRAAFTGGGLAIIESWQSSASPAREKPSAKLAGRTVAEVESWLTNILAARTGIEPSRIDRSQPITHYGLDSLVAIELRHGIETNLGIRLPMWNFLQGPSISELAVQATARVEPNERQAFAFAPAEANGSQEFPLSLGQQALWFLHEMSPESAAYNVWGAVRIEAELDTRALRESYQTLVDRHASLRTTFTSQDGQPRQRIHERMEVFFQVEDASAWSDASFNARLMEQAHQPFDLERGPLLRVFLFKRAAREHVLLLIMHHIITDLWSMVVLTDELRLLYEARRDGIDAELPPLDLRYTDFVRWQAETLASPAGDELWSYWQQQLAGELPTLDLPTDRPYPPLQTYRGASHSFQLPHVLTERLKDVGRLENSTLYMTLLAAFQVLLHRYTGQDDIIVGSPMMGRNHPQLTGIVGYFVNPLPMRADLSDDPTFKEFLVRVRETVLGAFEHQDYPFPLLTFRLEAERDPRRSPIFQTMFVYQKPHLLQEEGLAALALGESGGRLQLGDLTLESVALERHIAQFDMTLTMVEIDATLKASLEYNTDLFDAATVARFCDNFEVLLHSIARDPASNVSSLPLLSAREQRDLVEFSGTWTDEAPQACLHELFEKQAERMPDATAVVFQEQSLTYRELNNRANRLAHHLRSLGVGAETLVGICVERGLEMIVGLLSILKAGGAYVPLDPVYPPERLRFMLEDSQVSVLLTESQLVERLPAHHARVLRLDQDWPVIAREDDANPSRVAEADNLAYVIYTSGSTGRPKGVAIEHRSAVALVDWAHNVFQREQLACVLASTSISFDLSVFEIFVTLGEGGAIVVAENALQLPALAARESVTLINTVPSAMAELLRLNGVPTSVRVVNLAGEPLPGWLVRQVYHQTQASQVWNLYGPSEDTTYSTFALMERESDRAPHIGRPISNTSVYVLDANLRMVPRGVAGEVYIGGAGLARSYLRRPELTAERFIPNPWNETGGARMYRTGDTARYLPDGNLEFLGRVDNQVKLRGFRIELGEVESVLMEHAHVSDAVIVMREDAEDDKRIVAYVVPTQEGSVAGEELQAFLRKSLPEYMLPSDFVLLEKLPLTPNGKVNRLALPAPERTRPAMDSPLVLARTPTEKTLAEIWAHLLGLENFGVNDNFFKLGGHSLLATQLISRVRSAFHIELPLHAAFESPTIAQMAGQIDAFRWALDGAGSEPETSRVEQRVSGEI